jgi:hypothetical protein
MAVQVLALVFLPLALPKLRFPEPPLLLPKRHLRLQLTLLLTAGLRLRSLVLVLLVKPKER